MDDGKMRVAIDQLKAKIRNEIERNGGGTESLTSMLPESDPYDFEIALSELISSGDVVFDAFPVPFWRLASPTGNQKTGRHRFEIQTFVQDSVPVSAILIHEEVRDVAIANFGEKAVGLHSMWWQCDLGKRGLTRLNDPLSVGARTISVVVPLRITHRRTEDDGSVFRSGGIVEVPFTGAVQDSLQALVLVGQAPNEITTDSSNGVLSIFSLMKISSSADTSHVPQLQIFDNRHIADETRSRMSKELQESKQSFVRVAVAPDDETILDLMFIALERANIVPSIFTHHGIVVWVKREQVEDAIRVLQRSAKTFAYELITLHSYWTPQGEGH